MKGRLSVCFLDSLVLGTESPGKDKKNLKCVQPAFTEDAFEAKRTPSWCALWGETQARRSALRCTMGATSQSSARRWAGGRTQATLPARWRRHMGPSGRQGCGVGASAAGGPWEEVLACAPDFGQASAASSRSTRRGPCCQQQSKGASKVAGGAPASQAAASGSAPHCTQQPREGD